MKSKGFILDDLLDGCENARILEVFLENQLEDLEINEIAKMSDVPIQQVKKYLKYLTDKEILDFSEHTHKYHSNIDRETWTLNRDNKIVKALMILESTIIIFELDKLIDKKINYGED